MNRASAVGRTDPLGVVQQRDLRRHERGYPSDPPGRQDGVSTVSFALARISGDELGEPRPVCEPATSGDRRGSIRGPHSGGLLPGVRAVDASIVRQPTHDVQCQSPPYLIDTVDECSACCTCACPWRPWPGKDPSPARRSSCATASRRSATTSPDSEAQTGAQLVQRVGRGIRLTPEGAAARGAGRRDHRTGRCRLAELTSRVGPNAGRVRLAGFQPRAQHHRARCRRPRSRRATPAFELSLLDLHPVEALGGCCERDSSMRRSVQVRRHTGRGGRHPTQPPRRRPRRTSSADSPARESPTTRTPPGSVARTMHSRALSTSANGAPASRPASATTATTWSSCNRPSLPAWASPSCPRTPRAPGHRQPGIHATELIDHPCQIFIATYGDPPDPPATAALIATIQRGSGCPSTQRTPGEPLAPLLDGMSPPDGVVSGDAMEHA